MPSADSASEIVKFTISIPRESCTNAKAKYSSSVVPPDPSVHFYHCSELTFSPVGDGITEHPSVACIATTIISALESSALGDMAVSELE